MKVNPIYVIRHLRNTYGGVLTYKDNCFYVEVEGDKFRVNLSDKERFGYYTFFHRDSGRRLDGKYYYHTQLKDKDLAHGLFLVWSHKLNKSNGIWHTYEDWERFVNDAYKYAARSDKHYGNIESLCAATSQDDIIQTHQMVDATRKI